MLRTKIVCTIGPATQSRETLRELMLAGMDVARLNLSHSSREQHAETIALIREVSSDLNRPVAVLVDLQGPKLRVGVMAGKGVPLEPGETIVLTIYPIEGSLGRIPIQYSDLPAFIQPGEHLLLDDGLMDLRVLGVNPREITCEVVVGGLLRSNKGMNLPNASLSIPTITDKDIRDLEFLLERQVDWIALSFVRTAE